MIGLLGFLGKVFDHWKGFEVFEGNDELYLGSSVMVGIPLDWIRRFLGIFRSVLEEGLHFDGLDMLSCIDWLGLFGGHKRCSYDAWGLSDLFLMQRPCIQHAVGLSRRQR